VDEYNSKKESPSKKEKESGKTVETTFKKKEVK